MSLSQIPAKNRGAQPGNKNALKHGFYCRKLPDSDVEGLNCIPSFSLFDEIEVLRIFIRKVVELSIDQEDIALSLDALRAISNATRGINRLIRTQQTILPSPEERKNIYYQMLEKALQEMESSLQSEEIEKILAPLK
jgi:hypothetical protein